MKRGRENKDKFYIYRHEKKKKVLKKFIHMYNTYYIFCYLKLTLSEIKFKRFSNVIIIISSFFDNVQVQIKQ